jgi:hypothetical protein
MTRAIEDDCWSILASDNVNSLAASIALKKNLMVLARLPSVIPMYPVNSSVGNGLTKGTRRT